MSYKLYVFTFDPHKTDSVGLHKIIKDNPLIHDWIHYLSSTYIFASTKSLSVIRTDIQSKWPKQRFFMAEITKDNDGWLPKDAWEWIKKYEKEA